MSDYLQAFSGKNVVIELVNGRMISGRVLSADQKFIRVETVEGTGTIPAGAVYIVWEHTERSSATSPVFGQTAGNTLTDRISCASYPGFTCAQNYVCTPPDNCTYSFACPRRYTPGFPSGGGCNFYCGPFVFNQQCGPYQFQQPCGPYQFQQPCAFTFGQPCGPFQFGYPCYFQFQCGTYQFGGSQCGTPGGFTCTGSQFVGLVGQKKVPVEPGDSK